MGMYRTVWASIPCEHCGIVRRVGVQFKTGDDWLQDYEEGDVLAPDEGLNPADLFGGIAERHCATCHRQFEADLVRSSAEAYATLIESGRLVLRAKGASDVVDADAVRERGRERAEAVEAAAAEEEPPLLMTSFSIPDYDAIWEGKLATPLNDAWRGFHDALRENVDRKMQAHVWRAGGERFNDTYTVLVDDDLRVVVGEPV